MQTLHYFKNNLFTPLKIIIQRKILKNQLKNGKIQDQHLRAVWGHIQHIPYWHRSVEISQQLVENIRSFTIPYADKA